MNFILPVFPDGSLSSSLITTVWVGVMVVCFFNLRFGWNLTGLIVPGYLVPLIILKPWSAVAIIIEAVLTYLIVKIFSEIGPRLNLWCNLFGRDSFFAILLVSVVIRLLFDSYIFPTLSSLLTRYADIEFMYHGGLYSIGLVIVALTANQFWKNGLRKGVPELLVILLVTLLIIKYILLNFTNFRLNEVAYLYESLATSIMVSPKAYIILLTTAYIASRMNLLYGWEFSGIAIPALLALLWYNPFEILTSLIEAIIIYAIASLILKTPLFANAAIEGARKILLFFCVAFFYKLILGFISPLLLPDMQVSDFYGFGYMLTSFISIKMYDKQLGGRLIGATLMTSAFSVLVATVIGYMLTFFSPSSSEIQYKWNYEEEQSSISSDKKTEKLIPFVLKHMLTLYTPIEKIKQNSPKDVTDFLSALGLLDNYLSKQAVQNFTKVSEVLHKIKYSMAKLDNKYIVVYNQPSTPNKGIFIISTAPSLNYIAIIPYPVRNLGLTAVTLSLLTSGKVKAVAISGRDKNILEIDIFFKSYLFSFLLHLQKQNKELFFFDNTILGEKNETQANHFWTATKHKDNILNNLFSHELRFDQYKELPSPLSDNRILKGQTAFFLSEEGISKILPAGSMKIEETQNSIFYINNIKEERNAARKSLTIAECKFLDTQVISEIITATKNPNDVKKENIQKELSSSKFSANLAGYELKLLKTPENPVQEYIELSPKITEKTEGIFYFRTNKYSPLILETANTSHATIKLISSLSKIFNPQAIFFNNLKYDEKRENIILNTNSKPHKKSTFNLVRQVTIREIDSNLNQQNVKAVKPLHTIVQINQLARAEKYSTNTVYVSTTRGANSYSGLTKMEKEIYNTLKKSGLKLEFIDGQKNTMGLEANHSRYADYLDETANTSLMILWISPDIKTPVDLTFSKTEKRE